VFEIKKWRNVQKQKKEGGFKLKTYTKSDLDKELHGLFNLSPEIEITNLNEVEKWLKKHSR